MTDNSTTPVQVSTHEIPPDHLRSPLEGRVQWSAAGFVPMRDKKWAQRVFQQALLGEGLWGAPVRSLYTLERRVITHLNG